MKFFNHIFYFLLIILFLTASAHPSRACSIPVYDYALEHWSADPYDVLVFHRGALSAEDQAKVDKMQKAPNDEKLSSNITVRTINLDDSPNPAIKKLWENQKRSELPLMVVRYPRFSKVFESVWSGGLRTADTDNILKSPVRKEIARRIISGEVAVWAFLESGDKKEDKAKLDLLQTELKRMSETLKIISPTDFGQPAETDDAVKFSVLKISRNDPREKFFVQMLLNSEPDLKTLSKPMAFPIFGRGRALYALVGSGINADNIESVSTFLVGWCSCEVKELNPGVDILMSVDWDRALYDSSLLYEDEEVSEPVAVVIENVEKSKIESQKEEKPEVKQNEDSGEQKNIKADEEKTQESETVDSSDKLNRTELDKEIRRITASSNSITTPKIDNGSGSLLRNILITVLVIVVGVASVTSFMLWKRKQRAN